MEQKTVDVIWSNWDLFAVSVILFWMFSTEANMKFGTCIGPHSPVTRRISMVELFGFSVSHMLKFIYVYTLYIYMLKYILHVQIDDVLETTMGIRFHSKCRMECEWYSWPRVIINIKYVSHLRKDYTHTPTPKKQQQQQHSLHLRQLILSFAVARGLCQHRIHTYSHKKK